MLDHAGFPVSDYKRSKAFYEKALAPLGYVLVMEVPQTENDTPAAGFGIDRKPDFLDRRRRWPQSARSHCHRGQGSPCR
jgi:catechol 2,3-dioxygenase-like lactoylglutathione lyase family enzyme